MNPNNRLTLTTSPSTQPARKPRRFASLALRRRSIYGRERRCNAGKELDAETGLYYYGARYLDPKTSRWLSGDPAVGEYVPSAPVNEEAKKQNQNLPGMGGVFNYANLHVYHYAGNNPVKYVDPDGKQAGPPVAQQPNFLPPTNTPYNREPAYQGMMSRHKQAEAFSGAASVGSNAIGIIIDKLFLGGKYQKAADKFAIRMQLTFIDIKIKASRMFETDENGKYPANSVTLYTDYVNSTMLLNFTDQSGLGPYEDKIEIPRITEKQANFELNIRPKLDIFIKNDME